MKIINWKIAVKRTDEFYSEKGGLSYSDRQVDRWLKRWFWQFVSLQGKEKILDLCCGDGCWTFGLVRKYPKLEVTGVDVSRSAVKIATQRAKSLKLTKRLSFFSHDCEDELPLSVSQFDIIFARGLFVYNQHNLLRPGCLLLMEKWHSLLKIGGNFIAMYGSKPDKLGTYTKAEDTKGLPTNLCPRQTRSLDFKGGKFNHYPCTFTKPFYSLECNKVTFYQFYHGRHTLISERVK